MRCSPSNESGSGFCCKEPHEQARPSLAGLPHPKQTVWREHGGTRMKCRRAPQDNQESVQGKACLLSGSQDDAPGMGLGREGACASSGAHSGAHHGDSTYYVLSPSSQPLCAGHRLANEAMKPWREWPSGPGGHRWSALRSPPAVSRSQLRAPRCDHLVLCKIRFPKQCRSSLYDKKPELLRSR